MSSTNHTENYDLPQFTATDKPGWMTDINTAFVKIDEGMTATNATAEAAKTAATQAEGAAMAAETATEGFSDKITSLTNQVSQAQKDVETITGTANSATSTATQAASTANSAQTSVNNLTNKLLVTSSNVTVERFQVNPSNNNQLLGSLGHVIAKLPASGGVTSDWKFLSGTDLIMAYTPSGEIKIMGEINMGQGSTNGDIVMQCTTANFPTNVELDLNAHGIMIGSNTSNATNPARIDFVDCQVKDGKWGMAMYPVDSGTGSVRVLFMDSIITQSLLPNN